MHLFDLTSLLDAGEIINYPELSGESIPLEMFFDRPLGNATEKIVLGERMSTVKIDQFGTVAKMFEDFCVNENLFIFFSIFLGVTSSLSALEHLWVIYYCHPVAILFSK